MLANARLLHLELEVCTTTIFTERAATILSACIHEAIAARGRCMLALSGGNTPVALFALLRKPAWQARVDWAHTEVFWVDERCVPADHAASNSRAAIEALLDHVPVSAVHPMPSFEPVANAATQYETCLRQRFSCAAPAIPRFDCVVLGMGTDGHTASLFPGDLALEEGTRLVVPSHAPVPPHQRLTLTLPVLNAARVGLFLVQGANKHAPLERALSLLSVPTLPVQRVRPERLVWLVDEQAALPNASAARTL